MGVLTVDKFFEDIYGPVFCSIIDEYELYVCICLP